MLYGLSSQEIERLRGEYTRLSDDLPLFENEEDEVKFLRKWAQDEGLLPRLNVSTLGGLVGDLTRLLEEYGPETEVHYGLANGQSKPIESWSAILESSKTINQLGVVKVLLHSKKS